MDLVQMSRLAELDDLTTYLRDGTDRLVAALREVERVTYGRPAVSGRGGRRRLPVATNSG